MVVAYIRSVGLLIVKVMLRRVSFESSCCWTLTVRLHILLRRRSSQITHLFRWFVFQDSGEYVDIRRALTRIFVLESMNSDTVLVAVTAFGGHLN